MLVFKKCMEQIRFYWNWSRVDLKNLKARVILLNDGVLVEALSQVGAKVSIGLSGLRRKCYNPKGIADYIHPLLLNFYAKPSLSYAREHSIDL